MSGIKKYFCLFIMLLTVVGVFFPFINNNIAKTYALIEGVSGNRFVLTGLVGNTPKHYFTNDSEQSTLQNCKVEETGQTHYGIVPTEKDSGMASGWGELQPTTDMFELIKNGLLYVQASASVTSYKPNDQSNIKLTISSGNQVKFVQSNNSANQTSIIETQLLRLNDPQAKIKFYFQTLANASRDEKSSFVMDMPTIRLHTQISKVYLENSDQIVSPGQMIKLNAYNDITKISGATGNFLSYSKINHKINYEFLSGGEYAEVVGDYLVLSDSIPNGTIIKFKAYSRQNSFNDEKVYSENTVTLTVDSSKVAVEIEKDFENPATIIGNGLYSEGDIISLTVQKVNPGFTFEGWFINGELVTTKLKLSRYVVSSKDVIYAKFIKSITIAGIEVVGKVYDGTTTIDPNDVICKFNGIENGHELLLEGISVSYANENAGTGKVLYVEYINNSISLQGKDKDIYKLTSQVVPTSFGDIFPRQAEICPQMASKQYGDLDPKFNFDVLNLIEGETLQGQIGRDNGESVGEYNFNIGTLTTSNPNYTFSISNNGAKFVINKRDVSIQNVFAVDKIYDKTTTAKLSATLNNVYNNEDVSVKLFGNFVSYNAGTNIDIVLDNSKTELIGKDSGNYNLLTYNGVVKGNILPKEVNVTVQNCSAVYGSKINYNYNVTDVVEGDVVSCDFYVDGKDVGVYDIKLKSYSNKNYTINLSSAKCEITPKTLLVRANKATKTFGDSDPIFTYNTEGLLDGDQLIGALSRKQGENVGDYKIVLGTLYNKNYKIQLIENVLSIIQRQLIAKITFLNKIYDGSNNVIYTVNYLNNILLDEFNLNLDAKVLDCGAGLQEVNYEFISIEGDNVENYTFVYECLNNSINIEKRNVEIVFDDISKIYGELDPELTYTVLNLVEGDEIFVNVKRDSGENVGKYFYSFVNSPNEKNPNYNITIKETKFFSILPKKITITTQQTEKIFGDLDPEFSFKILDESQLCFGDTASELLDGNLRREEGEMVGVYLFDANNVSSSKNYVFVVDKEYFVINKRPVVVTCDSISKTYGDEDPVFTYTVSNAIDGQDLFVDIKREYGENVGEYQLHLATLSDPRYIITFESAILTIVPCDITVKAEAKLKVFGEQDPVFTVVIVDGFLKNNDILSSICQGNMQREQGENVGTYLINQGTFSLGKNYNLKFISNSLEIIQEEIIIEASYSSKIYGENDNVIEFKIVSGSLKNNDVFVGALSRQPGENVGTYEIQIGNLKINDNYKIKLISNVFEIKKRKIEVIPTTLFKTYGDEEPEITYEIIGTILDGDILSGSLKREIKDVIIDENVGLYKIISTLNNDNYEIIFKTYYFQINPAPITIEADSYEIFYGEQEPTLTYRITQGKLFNDDKISGSIYRIPGKDVGTYSIRSSLSLGKNYILTFIGAQLTIKPLIIVLECEDYKKVYGQLDPIFNYKIVEGQLIGGDKLNGSITREDGENVGKYKLINNLFNSNYNIILKDAYLTIEKKDVYLIASVYDKVYDGNNVAHIRNPYVTGLLDEDVVLLYDKESCAFFETEKVGNNLKVYLKNIQLFGENSSNYNLILPEYLQASITHSELSSENIKITSSEQAILKDGLLLKFDYKQGFENQINNHKALFTYNVWLEGDSKITDLNTSVKITINIPKDVENLNNLYVYSLNEKGEYELATSYKDEDGNLVIITNNLGEFYLATDNEEWIDYGAYISIGLILLLFISFVICFIIKKYANKKKDWNPSF